MSEGIICKVWNVKEGTKSRSAAAQLGDSLSYILNEEKTKAQIPDRAPKYGDNLANSINYAINNIKTLSGAFTGCINVSSTKNATKEMMAVKEFFNKTNGRTALHGTISLDTIESDINNGGKLMLLVNDVISEIFPGYQAVYSVHTNTDNLHAHFIINSVGLNGKKIHQDINFIKDTLQPAVNKYAAKYGFSVNTKWQREHPDTLNKKMDYKAVKIMVRRACDNAIERAETFEEFLTEMNKQGFTCNPGKHLSVKNSDMHKPMRTHQVGKDYSIEGIIKKIEAKYKDLFHEEISTKAESPYKENYKYSYTKLKRYKDMSPKEKKAAIKLLKEGRNPWQEHSQKSWAVSKAQKELTHLRNITRLVRTYSEAGNIDRAMLEIIERQRELAKEKKELKATMKVFKQPIALYKKMQSLAKRAFLYEKSGLEEYRKEYEKYQYYLNRLTKNFHKTPAEMDHFISECENELLFAREQAKELSLHYNALKNYKETGTTMSKDSLYEKSYLKEAKENDRSNYFMSKNIVLGSSNPDIFIRVVITPQEVNGKIKNVVTMTVLDRNEEVLDENNSKNDDFSSWMNKLQRDYSLKSIIEYKSFKEALYATEKYTHKPQIKRL